MIEKTEAARLAAAINALRPEWPAQSLLTFIGKNLADRAYRDAVIALAWVAADPQSITPARVLEPGPWWKATQAQAGTVSAVTHRCPEHPAERLWDCTPCRDAAATDPDTVAAGLALLREAAAARARRHPKRTQPSPPPTDLDAARQTIDTQEQP